MKRVLITATAITALCAYPSWAGESAQQHPRAATAASAPSLQVYSDPT